MLAEAICLSVFRNSILLLCAAVLIGCGSGTGGNSAQDPGKPKDNGPAKETKITFAAVGDMMISRGVARTIDREGGDPLVLFSGMKDIFTATDFNFGNLESPVSGNDSRVGKGLVFNARKKDIEGLVKYNFKIVNLANNHALDQGAAGLAYTQQYLTEKGILYTGVGANLDEAWKHKVIEVKGVKVAFIGAAYSSINDNGSVRNNFVARIDEVDRLKASIQKARAESDYVVVTMHAGIEYVRNPHQPQIDFARAAIDGGADIVIGAHPHWIQTFEKYKDKYIFYSLGNFIFDQLPQDRKEGLVLNITLVKNEGGAREKPETKFEKIEMVPVLIERMGVPRPATDAEAKVIFKKFNAPEPVLKN